MLSVYFRTVGFAADKHAKDGIQSVASSIVEVHEILEFLQKAGLDRDRGFIDSS